MLFGAACLSLAVAQTPPTPVPTLIVGKMPGALAPLQLANGAWQIWANTSVIVLPQQCVYYPTGNTLANSSMSMYAVYDVSATQSQLILDSVRYRNTTVPNELEIVAKLCSTLLNAPTITQGKALIVARQKASSSDNGTAPVLKTTGPYSTYGAYPVVQIAGNMYMLYSETNATITSSQSINTGIYLDTTQVTDPTTVSYSMYPATNCKLLQSQVSGTQHELALTVQQASSLPCTLTAGAVMAVAVLN